MKSFSQSSSCVQVIFLLALLILFLLQLYLLNRCYIYKNKKKFILNLAPMLGNIALSTILISHRTSMVDMLAPPAAGVLLLTAAFYAYTIAVIVWLRHTHKNILSADSVKEAYDHLPFGLCFFFQNELPVLCSGKMYDITRELIGNNMQSLGELQRALEHPADGVTSFTLGQNRIYRLADGREWFFSQTAITNHAGNRYIQVTAVDNTELNRLNAELKARNQELKRMMKSLERIQANIADSIREQEILTAKMRIHNRMGGCMTAARRYYTQNVLYEPMTQKSGKKAELLNNWNKTVADLRDEIGHTDESDPLDEPVRLAKNAGLNIVIHGDMPKAKEIYYLFVTVLRECIINAIRHAAATQIDVYITHREGNVTGVYKNNGKVPDREIVEGGGLTGLRSRIESAGGSVTVCSLPAFSLTVVLPEEPKALEDEDCDECFDCRGRAQYSEGL